METITKTADFKVRGRDRKTWTITQLQWDSIVNSMSDGVGNPLAAVCKHTSCLTRVAFELAIHFGMEREKAADYSEAYLKRLGRKVCGRCGGSGKHGPSSVWGGVCYWCEGSGSVKI